EALAEDEGVAARVGAETVIADPAVVVLVAGWDAAGRRMDRVVEAIAGPGDASALGERDLVGEGLSARDVEDMKGGHFGAATRQAVRDESPVGRRVPPVEGDERIRVEVIRVDDRPRASGLADVEHHIARARRTALEEDPTADRARNPEQAHPKELAEPRGE